MNVIWVYGSPTTWPGENKSWNNVQRQINCWDFSVKRSTRNITSQSARRTIYITLVRSQVGLVTTVRRTHLPIRTSTEACFKIHPWPAFSLRSQLRATAEEIEASSYQLLARVLDMMFLFKVSCGAINLPRSVLPTQTLNVRTTRSVQPNCLQFGTKKCYAATYQQSYTIRSTGIWNTLPNLITNKSNSLYTFKKYLLDYYLSALQFNI
jgi:hypothetical protein